ncbi:YeaH/YhbH family protein, partial [Mesorhizobium sp. M7A.F.Ca.CA.004.09.1.2]
PTNINVGRTMRNSHGRRIALRRPKQVELDAILEEIASLEEAPSSADARQRIAALSEELDRLERRRRRIAYVDPVDIRFNRFDSRPVPNANAVMFCLMDVSGSMGEREKDLAKRFFVLLHLFLKRRYDRIEIVFIRHTHLAQEVDEETFFYNTQSGGTVVSTALEEMHRIIASRYPAHDWNIYAAQASDGDNFAGDSERCISLLNGELMRLCQYFAYVEIIDEREAHIFGSTENGTSLWRAYNAIDQKWPNFQMSRIATPADIYPVFRQLFGRQPVSLKRA